jgi:hypothetical protein
MAFLLLFDRPEAVGKRHIVNRERKIVQTRLLQWFTPLTVYEDY